MNLVPNVQYEVGNRTNWYMDVDYYMSNVVDHIDRKEKIDDDDKGLYRINHYSNPYR